MSTTWTPASAACLDGRSLKPGTTVLWRSPDVVQLELGARRIVIENASAAGLAELLRPATTAANPPRRSPARVAGPIGTPDGVQSSDPAETSARPGSDDAIGQLYERLDWLGFLRTPVPLDTAELPARLTPDVAALSDGLTAGESTLRGRRNACVAVHGTTRLAVALASTLAAAGVGTIELVDGGTVSAADACPGGLLPADEGRRFTAAAAEAVRRVAPEASVGPIPVDSASDLVVLTDVGPVDPAVRADLHRRKLSHLAVSVHGRHAIIGPLVIPGTSSCLRCADLHRTDRDPAWPLLAVQLSTRPRHREPSDVAVTVAAAGLSAAHALAYLDGLPAGCLEATVELQCPDWRLRRRTWPMHRDCDCRSAPPGGLIKSRMDL